MKQGFRRDAEVREKMRLALGGERNLEDEAHFTFIREEYKKIRSGSRTNPLDETRAKLRKSMTRRIQSGEKIGKGNFGHFFSTKNNKSLHYHSSWELIAYQILETDTKVVKYEVEKIAIPYTWPNGSTHNYHPDLLVYYTNGHKDLIEIKPKYKLKLEKEITKIEAGKQYASEHNMGFQLWTEKKLFPDKK